MSGLILTCDRTSTGAHRAALWRDGKLVDYLTEDPDAPDLTGAVFGARIVRVAKGGKAAWADAGLASHVFLDKADGLKTGDMRLVRIKIPARGDKGASAILVEGEAQTVGLIEPPLPVWARLIEGAGGALTALRFSVASDRAACAAFLALAHAPFAEKLEPLVKGNPHPDLEEALLPFAEPRVALAGGLSLVIERTEALIAIDVNGGENQNPLAVNLAASKEIARQIRIRNLSGLIVVDALKMPMRADGAKLLNALKRAVENDPAGVSVFGLTKLGLVELTRGHRGSALDDVCGGNP